MSRGSGFARRSPLVAHFVPIYLPRTETFIYQVLTHHDRYRPLVVAQNRADTAALFPFPDVWTEADLDGRWSVDAWYRLMQLRIRGRRLSRFEAFLERRRARVLHVHFGHTGAEAIGLSRKLGIPQVTAFYGWDDTVALDGEQWKYRFERLFREGEAFLVEGTHIARRLAERGCPAERIHVHRIGVDVDRIPFRPASAPSSGDRIRLLFCGRLVEKKGLRYAIEAVGLARQAGYQVELRVIGDGPLRPEIERQIDAAGLGSSVTLLGARRYEEFVAELAAAHLYIQPSVTAADGETEGGAPTVLIEAQAAGKPILTTEHADIPEIVRPGESATVVPERDGAALGMALCGLIGDPGRWAAMAAAGRRHVEQEHEIRMQMRRLEEHYDRISGVEREW